MNNFYIYPRSAALGSRPRWIVASRTSGDFAVFGNKLIAKNACAHLNAGEAKFCPTCGNWVLYKGGLECPQCALMGMEINDAAERTGQEFGELRPE